MHLSVLRRDGAIEQWYDRDILAGGNIDNDISEQLENCDLFLALVSPDFLASNYCYEHEMTRALERHDQGTMRVIPIVVEPCDWKSSPLRKLKALPRDGKAVSDWTNENSAYLDIVTELRRVVAATKSAEAIITSEPTPSISKQERKYRVKRDFDEIDHSDFRETAFEMLRSYFEAAISEIDGIDGIRARFAQLGPQSFSATVINQSRDRGIAYIAVHIGSHRMGFGDIYFSFNENAHPNSMNGGFTIKPDDYDLFLQPTLFARGEDDQMLLPREASELLWEEFLSQAGISYD